MKIGIIDIGSNTIKAFVYSYDVNTTTTLDSRHYYAMLYSYIENGIINQKGLEIIRKYVSEAFSFLCANKCSNIHIFATSAVRDSSNKEEIKSIIYDKTALELDILTADEESECDIISLRREIGAGNVCGVDLGGGSAQIFVLNQRDTLCSHSFPLGALRMKEMFVSHEYPDEIEIKAIMKHTRDQLHVFSDYRFEVIHVMGGSAYNIKKLTELIYCEDKVSTVVLNKMLYSLLEMNNKESFLKKHAGKRALTVMPAIAVLLGIAEVFAVNEYTVHSNGVREGYLIKKIIK